MPKKRIPSYRLHRPSGLAIVTLNGQDHYLGRWGSPQSRDEYDRLIGEWLAGGRTEVWRWNGLWVRRNRQSILTRWLRPWAVDRPRKWLADVNRPIEEEALRRVRQSLTRGVADG